MRQAPQDADYTTLDGLCPPTTQRWLTFYDCAETFNYMLCLDAYGILVLSVFWKVNIVRTRFRSNGNKRSMDLSYSFTTEEIRTHEYRITLTQIRDRVSGTRHKISKNSLASECKGLMFPPRDANTPRKRSLCFKG